MLGWYTIHRQTGRCPNVEILKIVIGKIFFLVQNNKEALGTSTMKNLVEQNL